MKRLNVEAIYPLSDMQAGLLFHCIYESSTDLYVTQLSCRLRGDMQVPLFVEAWKKVVERHDVLRTLFVWENRDKPLQVVQKSVELPVAYLDRQGAAPGQLEPELRKFLREDRAKKLRLDSAPLMRIALIRTAPDEHVFVWTHHHLLLDGWSLPIVLGEVGAIYAGLATGRPTSLPKPRPFRDYIDYLRSRDVGEAERFWRKRLAGFRAATPIPLTPAPSDPTPGDASACEVTLSEATSRALQDLAKARKVTLSTAFQAAWAVLLSRYGGEDDVVFGTTVVGRPVDKLEGIDRVVGLMINTVPVRARLDPDRGFAAWMADLHQELIAQRDHEHASLPTLQSWSEIRSGQPLFRSLLITENYRLDDATSAFDGHFTVSDVWVLEKTNYPLTLIAIPGRRIQLRLEFDGGAVEGGAAHAALQQYAGVLEAIAREPDRRLSELCLVPMATYAGLVSRGVPQPPPRSELRPVHEQIAAQAARTPDALAIVGERDALTYEALTARAGRLAARLRELGHGRGARVGVVMGAARETAIGALAVLEAGAACVPLDPALSAEDLAAVARLAKPALVLCRDADAPAIAGLPAPRLSLERDDDARAAAPPAPRAALDDVAYVLCDGAEWIEVTHARLAERVATLQGQLRLLPSDAVLSSADVGLDAAFWATIWPLVAGGKLVLPSPARSSGSGLADVLHAHAVTVAHLSPAALQRLLGEGSAPALHALRHVRHVLSAQGVAHLTAEFRRAFACPLTELYSVAEMACEVAIRTHLAPGSSDRPPLGAAPTQPVFILDRFHHPAPDGVVGAIWIGASEGVRSSVAAHAARDLDAVALHHTGQMGRRLRDGSLEVTGDAEHHARVDGFPVDLVPLEASLLRVQGVEACAVLPRTLAGGTRHLIAYVVVAGGWHPERIHRELASLVTPKRLLPAAYVPLIRMPLTARGQVDAEKLASCEILDEDVAARCEAKLRELAQVPTAAVLVEEQSEASLSLHVDDLVHGWRAGAGAGGAEPADASPSEPQVPVQDRPVAVSSGAELVVDPDGPKTLTEALLRTAAAHPEKGITFVGLDGEERLQTYGELVRRARQVLAALRSRGLRPADRVILQVRSLADHLAAFWGCALGGIVPVTIAIPPVYSADNSVVNKLHNTWKLLDGPRVVASRDAVRGLEGLRRPLSMDALEVIDLDGAWDHAPAEEIHAADPADLVFLQLSAGSTGVPKVIQETHRAIIRHVHHSRQENGYTADDRTLNWLPLDHVVPILTYHLKDVYLGCSQVEVPTDVILNDPLRWLDLIEKHRVTHTWAPNFGFKLVAKALEKAPDRGWDLSSLRFLMNAGEQVTLPVVREFLERVAPFGVRPENVQPAFGMAEVCTCMTYTNDFSLERGVLHVKKSSLGSDLLFSSRESSDTVTFVDLGPPSPGVQIRITNDGNEPVREGVIGRFQIRSGTVTPGYYRNDQANREAFVGDGWFNTGDIGFMWKRRLFLTGREKEIIIVNGANFYCYEVEDAVNAVPGVLPTYSAAVGVSDPERGTEGLAIFFSPEPNVASRYDVIREIRAKVTSALGIAPTHVVPIPAEQFPKTTSGKIQRVHLRRQLLEGHFAETVRDIERHLGSPNTIPDWFYARRWVRHELRPQRRALSAGTYLVLGAEDERTARLRDACRDAGARCVTVAPGAGFAKLAPARFVVDPARPEDFRAVMEALAADGIAVDHVVHLWTARRDVAAPSGATELMDAQRLGLFSLLHLAHALERVQGEERPVRLLVCSTASQVVADGEPVACERAMVPAWLKTLPQETPFLDTCHVDLPAEAPELDVPAIVRELRSVHKDREVAYRGRARYVSRLARLDLAKAPKTPLPFKTGGIYLLTGGLGGVGAHVAEYLVQTFQARLLVVGRTPLPDRSGGSERAAPDRRVERLAQRYDHLTGLGADLIYVAGDVADAQTVERALAEGRARWGAEPDGVIHLAGVMPETPWREESVESLELALRAKIAGTWTLHEAFRDRPETPFILFSSLNGYFGGANVGAYAAASNFLEAFSHLRRSRGARCACLSWGMWDETGMSEGSGTKHLARARGYQALTPEQGIISMLALLHASVDTAWIGVDGHNPNVRHLIDGPATPLMALRGYVAAEKSVALEQLEISDALGNTARCRVERLPALPTTAEGHVDKVALAAATWSRGGAHAKHVAPRSATEEVLAEICAEVLGLPRVGVSDNFFELGGHSLLLTQFVSRIRKVFQIDVPLASIFKEPTVTGLARRLAELEHEPGHAEAMAKLKKMVGQLSAADVSQLLEAKKAARAGGAR